LPPAKLNLIKYGGFEPPIVPSGFVLFNVGSKIANRRTVVSASGNVVAAREASHRAALRFPLELESLSWTSPALQIRNWS
jgi:hypothetical protein